MKAKKVVYLDMDNVLVDFHSHPTLKIPYDYFNHPNMWEPTYFSKLSPLPGAIEAAYTLLSNPNLDVYILTQPVATSTRSYSEKAEWVAEYLPELSSKLIMSCNKLLSKGDYLVDDSLKWSFFDGDFIHFNFHNDTQEEWAKVIFEICKEDL
tara:strand:+ start:605 stop:1060 length:456 start_codon:yes stop_codon:yes gene_type:complete